MSVTEGELVLLAHIGEEREPPQLSVFDTESEQYSIRRLERLGLLRTRVELTEAGRKLLSQRGSA